MSIPLFTEKKKRIEFVLFFEENKIIIFFYQFSLKINLQLEIEIKIQKMNNKIISFSIFFKQFKFIIIAHLSFFLWEVWKKKLKKHV